MKRFLIFFSGVIFFCFIIYYGIGFYIASSILKMDHTCGLHENSLPPNGLYNRVLREIEYPLIALALSSAKGNQIKAAKLLGINRNTLRKKISELDINVSQLKKMI